MGLVMALTKFSVRRELWFAYLIDRYWFVGTVWIRDVAMAITDNLFVVCFLRKRRKLDLGKNR